MAEESKKMIKVTQGKLSELVTELRELAVRLHHRVQIGVNMRPHRFTRGQIRMTSMGRKNSTKPKLHYPKQTFDKDPTSIIHDSLDCIIEKLLAHSFQNPLTFRTESEPLQAEDCTSSQVLILK